MVSSLDSFEESAKAAVSSCYAGLLGITEPWLCRSIGGYADGPVCDRDDSELAAPEVGAEGLPRPGSLHLM